MDRGPHDLATPFLAVGWTLCFEMLFYTALAFTLARRWVGPSLLFAYLCAAAWFTLGHGHAWAFLGSPLILEFLAGLALARWRPRPSLVVGAAIIEAAVLTFALLYPRLCVSPLAAIGDAAQITYPFLIWARAMIYGTLAVAIVAGALMLEPWAGGAIQKRLAALGDASYSLYLVHPAVIVAIVWVWQAFGVGTLLFWPIAVGAAVGTSVLCYTWLERPLLKALRPTVKFVTGPSPPQPMIEITTP
jgi:exopolysaccharide production protein ExoZ